MVSTNTKRIKPFSISINKSLIFSRAYQRCYLGRYFFRGSRVRGVIRIFGLKIKKSVPLLGGNSLTSAEFYGASKMPTDSVRCITPSFLPKTGSGDFLGFQLSVLAHLVWLKELSIHNFPSAHPCSILHFRDRQNNATK